MPSVGFIGLGRMGSPMARRIAEAGLPLHVWNRTRATAEAFAKETAAKIASSPKELAGVADVVITMVSDGQALQVIYGGQDGVLAGLRAGKIAVDMSTVGPGVIGELVPQVEATGAQIVDAPVSGSVATAEAGKLMIMAGGLTGAVESVRPVLEAIGNPVLHVGESGAGATLKLAINSIVFGINEAVSEALVLAERAGVERSAAYNAFAQSAAAAPVVLYRRPIFEHPFDNPVTMSIDLAIKDLELILALARSTGTRMPQADENLAVMRSASKAGLSDEDMGTTAEYLRRVSNQQDPQQLGGAAGPESEVPTRSS